MAIDTRHKRFSMLGFADGAHLHVTFEADGAVDADDRSQLLDLYSGIGMGEPPIVVTDSMTIGAITVQAQYYGGSSVQAAYEGEASLNGN